MKTDSMKRKDLIIGSKFCYEIGRMNPHNPIYEVIEIGDEIKCKRLEDDSVETLDNNDKIYNPFLKDFMKNLDKEMKKYAKEQKKK